VLGFKLAQILPIKHAKNVDVGRDDVAVMMYALLSSGLHLDCVNGQHWFDFPVHPALQS
jgi:hypothetical protein